MPDVFPLESIRAAAVHPGQVDQFTIGDAAVPSANRVVEDAPRILAQNSLLEMLGEIPRSLVSDVFRANLPGAAIPPQAPQDGPLCGFAPDLQRSSQASVRGTLMLGTGRSAPVSLRARRTSLLILRRRAGDRRRAPGDARSNNIVEGLQIGPDPVRGAFEHVAEPPYGRAHVLPGLCAQLFKFGEFVEHPGQGSRRRQNR